MKISTKGRYALRLMADLGQHAGGDYISLKSISERQDITVKYLEQIVTILQRAAFVKSLRGNSGGYKLSRPAKEYSVGEILRVMEGSLSPVACLDGENDCARRSKCLTLPFWEGLQKVVDEYIDSFSLADLIESNEKDNGDSAYEDS